MAQGACRELDYGEAIPGSFWFQRPRAPHCHDSLHVGTLLAKPGSSPKAVSLTVLSTVDQALCVTRYVYAIHGPVWSVSCVLGRYYGRAS
jgi:hypothetical protein